MIGIIKRDIKNVAISIENRIHYITYKPVANLTRQHFTIWGI